MTVLALTTLGAISMYRHYIIIFTKITQHMQYPDSARDPSIILPIMYAIAYVTGV